MNSYIEESGNFGDFLAGNAESRSTYSRFQDDRPAQEIRQFIFDLQILNPPISDIRTMKPLISPLQLVNPRFFDLRIVNRKDSLSDRPDSRCRNGDDAPSGFSAETRERMREWIMERIEDDELLEIARERLSQKADAIEVDWDEL
uniref:Uncharacterized protein n=1 Tax=Candidatus Kentrum sp. DK TaxID=2126562 RepID=A0A450TCD0_9GAMM|nr:MAG: hypothetical protein BECKDK2373C_GA0170839_111811 [Candidatus Kentron sp. DK]VFJ70561.1 MAG: hypothetical protein BECKDK2373B_GA0170837_12882 [Candidatus Kentron sp. DK]